MIVFFFLLFDFLGVSNTRKNQIYRVRMERSVAINFERLTPYAPNKINKSNEKLELFKLTKDITDFTELHKFVSK